MKELQFDPREHFTPPDIQRLESFAARYGTTIGEFIEAAVKTRIWGKDDFTARHPIARLSRSRRSGTATV